MKKFLCFFMAICIILPVLAFGNKEVSDDEKIMVATTFNAVKEIVSQVAGDKINVVSIIPDSAEAHHYEPKRKDLQNLNTAKLLFINGLEMEEWVEDLVDDNLLPASKLVVLSEGLDLIKLSDGDEPCDCGHDHHHHHSDYDPHAWLGLTESAKMAEAASEALCKLDPENSLYYKNNATNFAKKVLSLRDEYRKKISSKSQKTIVVGHKAFGYLCRDLGLKQLAVRDTFNTGEASAKALASLVDFCKENKISVIFSEHMASAEVSKTLAREANARFDTLYTLEQGEEGLSFLDRQKSNLEKIYNSLK